MLGEFVLKGKTCTVSFAKKKLTFTDLKSADTCEVLVKDILSVEYLEGSCPSVRLHHVVPHTNKRLRMQVCDLYGSECFCQCLADEIKNDLKELTRPRRLLVFVNPKSGHKKGVKIYSSKVAPLLQLSGIYTEVIVTERAGQPKELLATYDLSLIHGIVSVGGDGMFSECVNGLLGRLQCDSHIDMHDPDSEIVASKIPIGIVPAGSGNYLVNYIHGTRDVETAVLKVILGDHHMSNVVSLHQGRQLTCYASLLVEFGLIGNMMHDCEKFRWLGPSRYSVVPISTLARRKRVDVEIEYMPEEPKKRSPMTTSKYLRQVSLPASRYSDRFFRHRLFSMPEDYDSDKKNDWKKIDGRVYGVDTYVVTQKEKEGSLVPRFGDHALTMWVTDKCSIGDHVDQLTKLQKAQSGYLNYDFIRTVRASRYRVKLSSTRTTMNANGERHLDNKFYINADGEAIKLDTPEFEVRLHQCTMPIFGKIDG
ncbi:ceramide kinase-like isoform X2 [Mercenaria mercenaria]|uniref:ceramide kinase-like isoform X2 n=1 Tax=Mercenaria mercenaria TaxID=6596 RepID=UPI00234E4E9B|nr:ceramide kinase-like isoform X2 [Mercenaria mercenaria]